MSGTCQIFPAKARAVVGRETWRPSDTKWRRLEIPKKGGGTRVLYEPDEEAKQIGRYMLPGLEELTLNTSWNTGFVSGYSVVDTFLRVGDCVTNSLPSPVESKVRQFVWFLDISDAFGSVTAKALRKVLRYSYKLSRYTVDLLVRISTRKGKLVMGAPASPLLFSLYLAKKAPGLDWAAYADDITVRATKGYLNGYVAKVLKEAGLNLNRRKTRKIRTSTRGATRTVSNLGLRADGKYGIRVSKRHKQRIRLFNHLLTKDSEVKGPDGVPISLRAEGLIRWSDWVSSIGVHSTYAFSV